MLFKQRINQIANTQKISGKTVEKYSKQHKDKQFLIRSSPYSPGLRLWSSFSGGLVLLCLTAKKLQYRDSMWVLLKQILLGRVVLGFPKPLGVHRLFFFLPALWPLVYSGKSQMRCSVRTDSSRERLESSSSLVLDAACGQLSPLSPLLGFTVLCFQSSSQGSLFTVSLGRLDSSLFLLSMNLHSIVTVHGFSHSIPMPIQFLSRLRRFALCGCAWSSLFGVSMNAQK